MKDKKANGKYANKSPLMRFVHKYTGWLVLTAGLLVLAMWWNYIQVEQDFYETWTCEMLHQYLVGAATYKGVMFADLPDETKQEYLKLLNAECPINLKP